MRAKKNFTSCAQYMGEKSLNSGIANIHIQHISTFEKAFSPKRLFTFGCVRLLNLIKLHFSSSTNTWAPSQIMIKTSEDLRDVKLTDNGLLFPTRCEMQNSDFPTTLSVRPAEMSSNSDLCVDGRDKVPSRESKDHRGRSTFLTSGSSTSGHLGLVGIEPVIYRFYDHLFQYKSPPVRSLRRQGLHFSSKDGNVSEFMGKKWCLV